MSKKSPGARSLKRLVRWLRRATCRHEFVLDDLKHTGIPEPEKPKDAADYAAWAEYFKGLDQHIHFTHRVQWPCRKCGKHFFAHCGLDISGKHGRIVAPPNKPELTDAPAKTQNSKETQNGN